MTDTADQGELVLLEALTRSAAVAEPATGHLGLDLVDGDLEAGGQAFDDDDQGLAVRFAGGEVAQHARKATGSVPRAPGAPRRA